MNISKNYSENRSSSETTWPKRTFLIFAIYSVLKRQLRWTKICRQVDTPSALSCAEGIKRFCVRQANPHNYDAWFDYLRLVENDADADTVREVYERAIANMPPIQEKRHWKRYIYLWINYALYEELEVKVRSSRLIDISL